MSLHPTPIQGTYEISGYFGLNEFTNLVYVFYCDNLILTRDMASQFEAYNSISLISGVHKMSLRRLYVTTFINRVNRYCTILKLLLMDVIKRANVALTSECLTNTWHVNNDVLLIE